MNAEQDVEKRETTQKSLTDAEARAQLPLQFRAFNLYKVYRSQGMSPAAASEAVRKVYGS